MKKQEKIKQGYGITSLICGLLGLFAFFMPYFGLPLSIMAMVFKGKQQPVTGLANAGNILGIIGIVINSIMLLILVLVLIIGLSLQ